MCTVNLAAQNAEKANIICNVFMSNNWTELASLRVRVTMPIPKESEERLWVYFVFPEKRRPVTLSPVFDDKSAEHEALCCDSAAKRHFSRRLLCSPFHLGSHGDTLELKLSFSL